MFAHPKIYINLIDNDEGDENWFKSSWFSNYYKSQDEFFNDRILSFEFIDAEDGLDECRIALLNEDYKLIDLPVFVRGQKYQISWGFPGNFSPPREMIVSDTEKSNPFVIVLHDPTILMDRKKQFRKKENAKDSEFVREIAAEYGYTGNKVHIEDTRIQKKAIVQPRDRTDARQLAHMAKRIGYEFWIDMSGLHWHRRYLEGDPVREFLYRTDPGVGSIIGQPQLVTNIKENVSTLVLLARDPKTKKVFEVEVKSENTDLITLGNVDEFWDDERAGKRSKRVTKVDTRSAGFLTREEAEEEALARYRMSAKGRYQLKFNIIGDAKLQAKNIINIGGVSEVIDGLYYINEIVHKIESGHYECNITADRDALRDLSATVTSSEVREPNDTLDLLRAARSLGLISQTDYGVLFEQVNKKTVDANTIKNIKKAYKEKKGQDFKPNKNKNVNKKVTTVQGGFNSTKDQLERVPTLRTDATGTPSLAWEYRESTNTRGYSEQELNALSAREKAVFAQNAIAANAGD